MQKKILLIWGLLLLFGLAFVSVARTEQPVEKSPGMKESAGVKSGFEKDRTELKNDLNKELTEIRADFSDLKQKAGKSNKAITVEGQQAVDRLDKDIRNLEAEIEKVTHATEANWESVKSSAKNSASQAKESLKVAQAKNR
jgi:archaellum component FlaC